MEPMSQLETGSFMTAPRPIALPETIRVVTWNINRGLRLDEVIEFLSATAADLILLQEVDMNARRTRCRNVARQIAQALAMNYVFGCEFEELSQRHNASPAYHGQATLSRFPFLSSRIFRFQRQSTFWHPRWFIPPMRPFQRRLGGRIVLINSIDLPERKLIVYNVHLESRGDDALRYSQLLEVLYDVSQQAAEVQVIVAGDFNANLRQEPAFSAIRKTGLISPFAHISGLPTTTPSRFEGSSTIDWILTKGPLIASKPKLHDSIVASDHYPLSLILSGRPLNTPKGEQHE
jgi:endonuclease/exonuclease/phosphatase family metal-dependent hydrolase